MDALSQRFNAFMPA